MSGHGGNIYEASSRSGISLARILDFSASINPLGLSKSAALAIRDGLGLLPHYPEPLSDTLSAKLAGHFKIPKGSVVCGNGSTELIYLIPRVLRPKRVLVTAPTFSEYERACGLADKDIKIKRYMLDKKEGFQVDPERFIGLMKGSDLAFLCNPNNPTGRLIGKNDVLEIARAAESFKCHLVVDEAFIDFCPSESVIGAVSKNPYLIVLRSLTKFYALAGLRIGFGVFHRDLASSIKANKEPWAVNILASVAAEAVLKDDAYRAETIKTIQDEKRFIEDGLRHAGIEFIESEANYYLLCIKNAREVLSVLKTKGILLRDCSNFIGLDDRYLRIAVRSRRENRILLKELAAICGA